jgi:voltage-gated potassium channel
MAPIRRDRFLLADLALASEFLERLVVPVLLVVCVFLFGTVGFSIIGDGRWSIFDCAYMTSITLTTVGYGETLVDIGDKGRAFAMVLMWSGMGVTLYAVSTVTAFVVEKNLMRMLRERRMERKIAALKGHIIVCGAGSTGYNVARELSATKRKYVIIDGNQERLEWVRVHLEDLFYLYGDATEEEILKRAGIERAEGIIAVLNEDSHNLLITVQARYVNPSIKIVARCNEKNLEDKFFRAGADYIVNPAFIGGMRMASEIIRPHVVSFLDRMLRGHDNTVRVEEVTVGEDSEWVGATLREADIRRHTGLMPIALKQPDQDDFSYNLSMDEALKPGSVLIVIGNPSQIAELHNWCKS